MTENKETLLPDTRAQSPQPQDADRALEDIELIEHTAGDLEFGHFNNGNGLRGNIGPVVMRACARLRATLPTDQYALGFEAGKKSRDQEVKDLVAVLNLARLCIDTSAEDSDRLSINTINRIDAALAKHNNNQGE